MKEGIHIKTVITLTLEEPLTAAEKRNLQFLISDALYEFRASRLPVEEYVTKRYHRDDGKYALGEESHRADKVAQVQARCDLANKLHDAALHLGVTDIE